MMNSAQSMISLCRQYYRQIILGLVFFLFVLHVFGLLSKITDTLVAKNSLEAVNKAYLKDSSKRTHEVLLMTGVAKSGLSILSSARAGISLGVDFNVQVGDIIRSTLDSVDMIWKIILASTVSLFSIELLLDISRNLSTPLAGLFLILLPAYCVLLWWGPAQQHLRTVVGGAVELSFLLAVTFYLLIPLSVFGAAMVSKHIISPMAEQTHTQLDESLKVYTPAGDMETKKRVRWVKKAISELEVEAKTKSHRLLATTKKIIAIYLFETIIFPLGFLFFFYKAAPVLVARLRSNSTEKRLGTTLNSFMKHVS